MLEHIMTQQVSTLDVETNKDVMPLYYQVVDTSAPVTGGKVLAGPFESSGEAWDALAQYLREAIEIVKTNTDSYEIHYIGDCVAGRDMPLTWDEVVRICGRKGVAADDIHMRRPLSS